MSEELRKTIMDAMRSVSERADEFKAGCAMFDGEWPDAEDKAIYDAEVALVERLRVALAALPSDTAQAPIGEKTASVLRLCVRELRDWMSDYGQDIRSQEAIQRANALLAAQSTVAPQAAGDAAQAPVAWANVKEDGVIVGLSQHQEDIANWQNPQPLFYGAPVPPAAAAPSHTDDAAVDEFAAAMKEKLAKARAKGRGGWEQCAPADLSRMLREHVEKGDPRDVANFCMMLWHHTASISDAALPWGKRANEKAAAQPDESAAFDLPPLPAPLEIDWPELHSHALGCGVEDRNILDRYEAAEYGWLDGADKAAERVPEEIFTADQMREYALAAVARATAPQAQPDERAAPTDSIPLHEDMLRALEHVECVYRQNVVKDGEPSSTLANLQRVIARARATAPQATMPLLTDAMRAVLRNENCIYGSEDDLYTALCAAADVEQRTNDDAISFIKDISTQKPEKPDYWSACGQCEHNIERAQEILESQGGT